MKKNLILTIFLTICSCYMVDDDNYFYLNTSYAKKVISFTVGFKVNQPASVEFKSDILVPQGNHIAKGVFD